MLESNLEINEALEAEYGSNMECVAISNISSEDNQELESDNKSKVDKLIVCKSDALRLFNDDPAKCDLINSRIQHDEYIALYYYEDRIHLYLKAQSDNVSEVHGVFNEVILIPKEVNKVYGLKLLPSEEDPDQIFAVRMLLNKKLGKYLKIKKISDSRDHRVIGKQQGLFYLNEFSPGSWNFSKEGAIVYHKLIDMMREQYKYRGYDEVISPNLYNLKMFKISGHYDNYKKNMFMLKSDGCGMALKPMNCPGHYMLFKSKIRSYRELPLRFAEFGILHRNELAGALSGLSRCRRFCVDDSHIFCAESQIQSEILNNLQFVKDIYSMFNLQYKFFLSPRPENYLGDDELWEKAELQLKEALDQFGEPWEENPGDGAFYGPKIDIVLYDSMSRPHQCASIQVDFQAPIRFNLMYKSDNDNFIPQNVSENQEDIIEQREGKYFDFPPDEYDKEHFKLKLQPLKPGYERPVVLHRAVLGSIERFISILIEHIEGKWPFWLSPRQAIVIPISEKFSEYAHKVHKALKFNGIHSSIDESDARVNKKIRNAQLAQFNYMLVVGQEEMESGEVDVRSRENGQRIGKFKVDDLIEKFEREKQLIPKYSFSENS